ncbi:MAG: PDZ domain-containing protein [Verrucomicrobiota bacterium]
MSKLMLLVSLLVSALCAAAWGDIRIEVKRGDEDGGVKARGNSILATKKEAAREGDDEEAMTRAKSTQKTPSNRGSRDFSEIPPGQRAGAGERERRVFIGVALAEVPPAVRAHLDIPVGAGIMVEQALPNSPAEKAGIQAHDIVVRLDDQIIVNGPQLQSLVQMKKKGDTVTLTVMRKGKERQMEVELGEQELLKPMAVPSRSRPPDSRITPRREESILRGGSIWRDPPVAPVPPAPPAKSEKDVEAYSRAMEAWEEQQARLKKQNEEMRERLEEAMEQHRRSMPRRRIPGDPGGSIDGERASDVDASSAAAGADGFPVHVYADSHAIVIDGPSGKMEFKSSGEDGTLVIMGPDGEVVFDGALEVPAELKDLPAKAAAILELMDVEELPFLGRIPALKGDEEADVDGDLEVQDESNGDQKKGEGAEVKERRLENGGVN